MAQDRKLPRTGIRGVDHLHPIGPWSDVEAGKLKPIQIVSGGRLIFKRSTVEALTRAFTYRGARFQPREEDSAS